MQDAQQAEEKITHLEEELAKAQAAADVVLKGSALDQKKTMDAIKAQFDKDQAKAQKKIAKLTKQVDELTGATEE
jgi:ElaB/YqjD/DUF883 family membrane-anchored ribosome-binding protein